MTLLQQPGATASPAVVDNEATPTAAHRAAVALGLPTVRRALDQVQIDLQSQRSVLVPVRLFIGLGWLRASAEKLADPGWLTGASLASFLTGQLDAGQVALPSYAGLMAGVFLPHVQLLSWIVLIGQVLAGLGILLGAFSRGALLGGLFMNLNFLLAGVPNPNAFYLVIQGLLLLARSGGVLGLDSWLGRNPRLAWLCASPTAPAYTYRLRRWPQLVLSGLFVAVAVVAVTFVRDFSAAGSVHDPAMILVILALMAAGWAGLAYLRRAPAGGE